MVTDNIKERLTSVLEKLNYNTNYNEIILSNRKDLCDYQYDGSFKQAKELHLSPMVIGENIVNKWQELYPSDELVSILFATPGFINFKLKDEYINNLLNNMNNTPKFGIKLPKKETYFIDYGGPNIAKPLHVGHLRSAIVGESIKRIIEYMGSTCISDVHLGDYGLQIGQVIYGLTEENIKVEDITLSKLEEIYPKISGLCKEDEKIKTICADITKQMQDGNKLYQEYFKKIRDVSGEDIKRIYKYLDVSFSLWYGESDSYKYIDELTDILNSKNLLTTSDGAKIINIKKDTDTKEMPPFIYQKSNGAYLYSTTDLATILERIKDYNPNHFLYVTDNRQALHFESLFRVCELLGFTNNSTFEHLPFGTVNGPDNKPFKTRAGNAPKLDDLFKETKETFISTNAKNETMSNKDLDILVNAIIKFADLQNNREKDYIFDIQKFSEVVGKTGPYLLYTYTRINRVINGEQPPSNTLNNVIYNMEDRNLRMKILELESVLNNAFDTRLPSVLANYVYELCVNLNAFYEINHINNLEDKIKKDNWLTLLKLGNNILKEMLNLLIIAIPEKM